MSRNLDVQHVGVSIPSSETASQPRKRRGMRRPRTTLQYQIDFPQEVSPQPGEEVVAHVVVLRRRLHMLQLIIRRNKNQHRLQPFYKYMSLLRSSLRKLLRIQMDLAKTFAAVTTNAHQVRQKFEREAELRSQHEFREEHIREVLVPKCYLIFSSLVNDSQFANLGIVLVGLLAEVAAGEHGVGLVKLSSVQAESGFNIMSHDTVISYQTNPQYSWVLGQSIKATGEDIGQVVERRYEQGVNDRRTLQDRDAPDQDDLEKFDQESGNIFEHSTLLKGSLDPMQIPDSPTMRTVNTGAKFEKSSDTTGIEKQNRSRKKKSTIDDLFSSLV